MTSGTHRGAVRPTCSRSRPTQTHLYVSVHVGGILRTTDGVAWTPTIDLHDDVHQVAVGDDGTVWAATGMRGLAESRDHGATWRYHTDGLHARYALAVAATPPRRARRGLVRVTLPRMAASTGSTASASPGATVSLDDLGGAVGPRQIAASGERAVIALPNGDVYVSEDGGAHGPGCEAGVGSVGRSRLHQLTVGARRFPPRCRRVRSVAHAEGGQSTVAKPAILTVDDDPAVLQAITRDLRSRFGEDYQIVRATSGADGLKVLGEFADARPAGGADRVRPADAGDDRRRVPGAARRSLRPTAKLVLLTAYADTDVAIKAINDIGLDYYLLKPWDPPEERLYPVIEDLLERMARRQPGSGTTDIRVVGPSLERSQPRDQDVPRPQPHPVPVARRRARRGRRTRLGVGRGRRRRPAARPVPRPRTD